MKYFLILLLFGTVRIFSQPDSAFSIDDAEIESRASETFLFPGSNRISITNDTLFISTFKYTQQISLNDVELVRIKAGTLSQQGLIGGACGGFVLGFVVALFAGGGDGNNSFGFTMESGLISGIIVGGVAAMIGGLIGSTSPYFDECNISQTPAMSKKVVLQKFLKKHKAP